MKFWKENMNKETFIDLVYSLQSLTNLDSSLQIFLTVTVDDDFRDCLYASRASSTLLEAISKGVARTLDYADYKYFKDIIDDYMTYGEIDIIENDEKKILDTPEQVADYIYG